MLIEDLISRFNTTPFLFLGSGITRRYYDLPDWNGLLEHFAREVKNDEFSYSAYKNRADKMDNPAGLLPRIAELIQADYDEKWFREPSIRHLDGAALDDVKRNGTSPFKAEISQYIKSHSVLNPRYVDEVGILSEVSKKNISGIITTNYDTFVEDTFEGYSKFVGQKQLIFSSIQGIAEIYKIHGSVELPNSIVINQNDYLDFEKNSEYLAAKLMTIFMEYPIIFIGYSISDSNIRNILRSIVNCLDLEQLQRLEDRFVFVEYQSGKSGVEITPYTIMFDDKPLTMQKIILDDFSLLYAALQRKQTKLPARLLRKFKEELYAFTLTNSPTAHIYVAELDDSRVSDEDLVLSIGHADDLALKGLTGLEADEWYRNIIMGDLKYSADNLLKFSFPKLYRQNSGTLPLNKYLAEATEPFPEIELAAQKQNFDFLISNTIKKHRKKLGSYHSVMQIWTNEKTCLWKATDFIAHLEEKQIDVAELESVLSEIFKNDKNVLQSGKNQTTRTNVKRLIRIYDYLKWGKSKNSPTKAPNK